MQCCADSFDEGIDLERFGEVIEDTKTARRSGSLDGPMCGHEDDLCFWARFVAMFEQFEAGPVSEIDIGDDEIEGRRANLLPCLICRCGRMDVEPLLAESQRHHLAHGRVVVDDENLRPCHHTSSICRQTDRERAAVADLTVDCYASSVPINDLLDQREPEPGAGRCGARHSVETVEDAGQTVLGDTGTVIAHDEVDLIGGSRDLDLDAVAGVGVFDGIADEVIDDPIEQRGDCLRRGNHRRLMA